MSIDPRDEALASLRQKRDLILAGKTLRVDIQDAITDVQVARTIAGAPTLTISISDQHKVLLKSDIFGHETVVRLIPFTYEVAQVSKSGTSLTVTCEDQVVAELRKNTKPMRVDPGKLTHVEFAQQLVRQDAKWIKFITHTGGVPVIKSKNELVRGDPTKPYKPNDPSNESTWDAINREANSRGWRVFVRGVDELWYVPDTYLFSFAPTFLLMEGRNGVDTIDFDFDEGKPIATATVTCRAGLWTIPPGNVAQVKDHGAANGKWLIQDIARGIGSLTSTVTLIKPQPVLPEPKNQGAISASELGGAGAGGGITIGQQSSGATTTPGNSESITFDQLVKYAIGGGFPKDMGTLMAAIAMAESRGVPTNLNNNPSTGDYSFGLWQINMIGALGPPRAKEFGITTYDQLFDPAINALAAYKVYKSQGLAAWTTYKTGAYLVYMPGSKVVPVQ